MKKHHVLLSALCILLFISCNHKNGGPPVVTKEITYIVQIKNPDTIPDTRHEFMDDSSRIQFLKNIIDPVLSGEVTAYINDNKYRPATPEELKKIFIWDKNTVYPADFDTINGRVHLDRITKIRYWEEWSMHRKTLQIEKRVLGLALIQDNYDDTGMYRGTQPLFYIFYDKEYPAKLEK